MKRLKQRVLAGLLAFIMCISTINVPAFAQETETINDIQESIVGSESEVSTENSEITDTSISENSVEVVEENSINKNQEQLTSEIIYENENYNVTFSVTSSWESGYNADIKIENIGNDIIQNWYLSFEYDDEITNIWNAEISTHKGNQYIIKNAGWNQDIVVGGSIEFGISGSTAFKGFPESVSVVGGNKEVQEEDYSIKYNVDSDWGSGFTGSIQITNNTDNTLEDWVLEFDFEREIANIWNAVIESHDENHYVIRNAGYNSNIGAGETIFFGFSGTTGSSDIEPTNYKMHQYSMSGTNIEDIDFELDISDMELKESDAGNFYLLTTKKSVLSGWAKNISSVDEFKYVIEDENTILCSGDIDKNEEWITNNIGFSSGYNLVTLTASVRDEKIEKSYIIINMDLENMNNLNIDLNLDSDSDNIPDYFEEQLGLNPIDKDTDGDGLNDYIEVFIPNISPVDTDGDQDNILDIDEDYDNDGLSNYDEENVYYTDLSLVDTDDDGLSDKEEVLKYYTNPNKEDTDDDGLDDYWEIKILSNPLEKDSSFTYTKVLNDSDEYLTIPTVTVENISAEQVKTFSIDRIKESEVLNENIPGFIDNGYEFNIEGTFEAAVVEIAYDASLNDDDFHPALYYYNEETQLLEYVEKQRIEDGKVIATLEHFSKYILINKTIFDEVWSYSFLYDENAESYEGLDIIFVIDSSGSMSWNDPNDIRKSVTKEFIDKLTDADTAALVSFDSTAVILSEFTNDKEQLNNAVDKLDSSGGTSLSVGISRAISLFKSKEESSNKLKYIIMLTDGAGSYSTTYTTQAVNENIIIYTVGLGSSVSKSVLTKMAETTGGCYYHVNEAEQLYYIFDTIAEKADYYKDTDKDGLNDYYEKEMAAKRLVLGTGVPLSVSYLNADSDGDGLSDGEEIKVTKSNNIVYVSMYSNPAKQDTDKDGMNDDVDSLPLVPNNISELLIHQTQHGEGLKKYTEFSENTVADDLTFNDYSYTEIVKEVGAIGTVAGITPEFMMWAELTDLFLLGCVTSDLDMSITLIDMLDEFRYGNQSNIGDVVNVGDAFETNKYNRYSDYTLTERSVNYEEFSKYLNDIKNIVIEELSKNDGNLLVLESTGPKTGLIYDMAYDNEIDYPVFSLKKDVALVLAIHDFQGHNITITNYKCDGNTFSGTIEFHFYDHFGLDNDDYEWAPGFCDWFTLQHYDKFNGKYAPFITVVDTTMDFSGVIK